MLSEAEATGALPQGVELAAVNGKRSVTLAGPEAAIAELAARFERSGVGCRRLQTSHAFHSAAMEPAMAPFREAVAGVELRAPEIPIVSTLTGDWLLAAEATDPGYWARQLRRPVRYGEAVARLRELSRPLLLEVGSGAGLIRLARQALAGEDAPESRGVASLPEAVEVPPAPPPPPIDCATSPSDQSPKVCSVPRSVAVTAPPSPPVPPPPPMLAVNP